MHLWRETLDCLKENGKSPADVSWVQFDNFYCSWDQFERAATFEYDEGFGGNNIKLSLKVVGDDWWLERAEYDGSEWWEFKCKPTRPIMHRIPIEEDLKT